MCARGERNRDEAGTIPPGDSDGGRDCLVRAMPSRTRVRARRCRVEERELTGMRVVGAYVGPLMGDVGRRVDGRVMLCSLRIILSSYPPAPDDDDDDDDIIPLSPSSVVGDADDTIKTSSI